MLISTFTNTLLKSKFVCVLMDLNNEQTMTSCIFINWYYQWL